MKSTTFDSKELGMQRPAPIGASAAKVSVSSYRHENWRMDGPPPLIVNPNADLHALMAYAWGEARDIEGIVLEFLTDADVTAQALANILFARLPQLVAMLEFLADRAHEGEIRNV